MSKHTVIIQVEVDGNVSQSEVEQEIYQAIQNRYDNGFEFEDGEAAVEEFKIIRE